MNIVVLTFTYYSLFIDNTNWFYTLGFIPNSFNMISIISSMFIHGGFGHILSNMWFLYIFGDNVESILGHVKFFVLFFVRFWSCLCTVYNRSKFINTNGRSKWCYCWCLRGIHDQLPKSKSSFLFLS